MKKRLIIISLVFAVCLSLLACDNTTRRGTKKEYLFAYRGVEFSVGDDADGIVENLGEPNSTSSAPSCAGEGRDELYIYNGFRIYTHRDANVCRVTAIELTNDTVGTPEGVRIGDAYQRIAEIYGAGEENKGRVEYSSEGCRLRFYLREGRVSGIKYLENDG